MQLIILGESRGIVSGDGGLKVQHKVYIFSSRNGSLWQFCEFAKVRLSYGYSFNIANERERDHL